MAVLEDLKVQVGLDDSQFTSGLKRFDSKMAGSVGKFQKQGNRLSGIASSVGSGIAQGLGLGLGMGIANLTAGLVGLGPKMVSMGADFEATMANVNSLLQLPKEQLVELSDAVLDLGANSLFGGQQAAESMYEIASGVADVSTHMAILDAAIRTAEAGNADLMSTTSALVSIMNAYSFSAEEAGYASDVVTKTVGMGVGTMDEFGQAIAGVSGLGAELGIDLHELGSELAYITTKGFSASEASTQLNSLMTAMIKPGDELNKVIHSLGFKSGAAMIEMHGLSGAADLLKTAVGGDVGAIAELLGRKEALLGFLAVTGKGFNEFAKSFMDGVNGATESARKFQLDTFNAQLTITKNKFAAVGIILGTRLLPNLTPIVVKFGEFADALIDLAGIDIKAKFSELAAALDITSADDLAVTFGALGVAIALIAGPTMVGGVIALGIALAGIALALAPFIIIGAGVAAVATDFGGVRSEIIQLKTAIVSGNWVGVLAGLFNTLMAIPTALVGMIDPQWIRELLVGFGMGEIAAYNFAVSIRLAMMEFNHLKEEALHSLAMIGLALEFPDVDYIGELFSGFSGGGIISTFMKLSTAVKVVGLAFTILGAPIVLIGAALGVAAGAAYLLYQAFTDFAGTKEKIIAFGDSVSDMITDLVANTKAKFEEFKVSASEAFATFEENLPAIAATFSILWDQLKAQGPRLAGALGALIGSALGSLATVVKAYAPIAAAALSKLWDGLRTEGPQLAAKFGALLGAAVVMFGDLIIKYGPTVLKGLASLLEWVVTTAIPELIGLVADLSIAFIDGFLDGLTGEEGSIEDQLGTMLDDFVTIVKLGMDEIVAMIKSSSVGQAFGSFLKIVNGFILKVGLAFIDFKGLIADGVNFLIQQVNTLGQSGLLDAVGLEFHVEEISFDADAAKAELATEMDMTNNPILASVDVDRAGLVGAMAELDTFVATNQNKDISFRVGNQIYTDLNTAKAAIMLMTRGKTVNLQIYSNVPQVANDVNNLQGTRYSYLNVYTNPDSTYYGLTAPKFSTVYVNTVATGNAITRGGLYGLSMWAKGGNVGGGTPIIVGEEGPEIFTPGSNGHITPNNKIGGMGGGSAAGGGTSMSFAGATFNITGVENVEALAAEIQRVSRRKYSYAG